MKNKILALLATIGLVSSVTAVEINDNLSINGFIDGSYSNEDLGANAKGQDLGIDEVELNFLVNVGNISGVINLDSQPNTNGEDFGIEQAHITYSLDNGVSFTFGRYGSALGLEGEDPAGLYTYSRAYSDGALAGALQGSNFNFANIDGVPGSVEGLTVSYAADLFSVAASFENPTGDETLLETNDLNIELSLQYTGIENTVIGAGFFFENTAANVRESDAVNVYFTTSFGKLLVGAEYSEISTDSKGAGNDDDRDAYMVLFDYDFNDKLGAALRFSSNETPNDAGDFDRMTIAPNYQITESLGAIVEFSDIDDRGNDGEEYAVELTYTF
jgi:hypothetical protein